MIKSTYFLPTLQVLVKVKNMVWAPNSMHYLWLVKNSSLLQFCSGSCQKIFNFNDGQNLSVGNRKKRKASSVFFVSSSTQMTSKYTCTPKTRKQATPIFWLQTILLIYMHVYYGIFKVKHDILLE